jgi:hypothetical protein
MPVPLISAAAIAAPRRALLKLLVHAYDRVSVTTTETDGDEMPVLGVSTVGVTCRYEAAGQTLRTAEGLVLVSGPQLTVAHDDPLAIGDLVVNVRNSADAVLLRGPLTVARRVDDDPLGLPLLRTYELHGADPQRAF